MSPVSRQYPWGFQEVIPRVMYPIILDLARDGNEPMFNELAGCLGVNMGELSTLWRGTRKRLGFKDTPSNVGRAEGDAGHGSPQGVAEP